MKSQQYDYDQTIVLRNILFLAASQGMSKKELEERLKVSPGYFSRVARPANEWRLPVGVLMEACSLFGYSPSALLEQDLTGMTPDQLFFCRFIETVIERTEAQVYLWGELKGERLVKIADNLGQLKPAGEPLFCEAEGADGAHYELILCRFSRKKREAVLGIYLPQRQEFISVVNTLRPADSPLYDVFEKLIQAVDRCRQHYVSEDTQAVIESIMIGGKNV